MMGGLLLPGLVQAQNHPCDPPSVIPCHVCGFDTFYGSPPRQLPNGWTGFVLAGDLTFMQDIDTFWGAPALRMWSNGGIFKAGVFTRVRVTPGAGYRAAVFWAAPNAPETFGRQLGIDPTGGVDPTASTVIWGPMHWGPGRILSHTPPKPVDIDAIALYPDEHAPALAAATPAPPNPTPAPLHTPTPSLTSKPTPTATATATTARTPSVTLTVTAFPVPTKTRFSTTTSTFGKSGLKGLRTD